MDGVDKPPPVVPEGPRAWASPRFAVPVLSLVGIPPLPRFWAKLQVLQEAFAQQRFAWGAIALLVSVLMLYTMMEIWLEAFWKRHRGAAAADRAAHARHGAGRSRGRGRPSRVRAAAARLVRGGDMSPPGRPEGRIPERFEREGTPVSGLYGAAIAGWAAGVLTTRDPLATLMATVRIVRGRRHADRVVALDIFLAAAVALCVAASLGTGRTVLLDVAIGLTLVGFLATVGWA